MLWKAEINDFESRSEEKLFEHLLAYVGQFDQPKREEALSTLLPLVRYSYLRGRFLLGKIEANETINKLPVLQRMLHEVYRYKLFPKSKTDFITRSRRGTSPLSPFLFLLILFVVNRIPTI